MQGKLEEALKAYSDGLTIMERLGVVDQSNNSWARDLSLSQNNVGDVLVAQGKLDEALKAYRGVLAIRERLATADPSNTEWERDLSLVYGRIGNVLKRKASSMRRSRPTATASPSWSGSLSPTPAIPIGGTIS